MRSVIAISWTLFGLVGVTGCQHQSPRNDSTRSDAGKQTLPSATLLSNELVSWQPLAKPEGGHGSRFHRLTAQRTGVDFLVPIDTSHPLKRLYAGGFFCGGVSVGDIDDDGMADLFLVSGPSRNGLFRQVADLQFENITGRSGVSGGDSWGTGAAMADIDNDGDLDIYVCNYDSPNELFINEGDAVFVESAREFGLDLVDCCVMPAFCDYDNDGDLDCYVLTYRYYLEGGIPRGMKMTIRNGQVSVPKEYERYYRVKRVGNKGQLEVIGRPDYLLRNNGDGTFTNVAASVGISPAPGRGLSATWWDYNVDGKCDLYVGNDFNDPDHLYRNNGDGTFTDVIAQSVPHTTWFSMGADFGDVNNDGLLDFLSVDMSATTHFGQKTTMGDMGSLLTSDMLSARPQQYMRNALYLNTGTDRFFEAAYLAGPRQHGLVLDGEACGLR